MLSPTSASGPAPRSRALQNEKMGKTSDDNHERIRVMEWLIRTLRFARPHRLISHHITMIQIRPANTNDGAALWALVRLFPTPTPPGEVAYTRAFHAKLLDPASFLAVAEQESTLVGYLCGYRHATFYAGGYTAWIDELLVLEAHRRRGVGRALMNTFETWAEEHACKLVSLATAGAAAFYERLGYTSKAGYYKKYLSKNS
jgi:GNAT superfamily N-acetyltransferase